MKFRTNISSHKHLACQWRGWWADTCHNAPRNGPQTETLSSYIYGRRNASSGFTYSPLFHSQTDTCKYTQTSAAGAHSPINRFLTHKKLYSQGLPGGRNCSWLLAKRRWRNALRRPISGQTISKALSLRSRHWSFTRDPMAAERKGRERQNECDSGCLGDRFTLDSLSVTPRTWKWSC